MRKRILSIILALVMALTLLPTAALAEGTISLSLSYDDSLCSVRIYDGNTEGETPQTEFVTGNGQTVTVPSGSWLIFEISDIQDGYRIGSVTLVDGNEQTDDDRTDGFVGGGYGSLGISNATRSYAMTVVIEPIPSSLPSIGSVTLYTDMDGTQPAAAYTNYTAASTDARLYGIATYSDGASHPNYYATGQWQYSTDGTTWHDTTSWGSNRYDFWPGWGYHEELNFLTASYDIRLRATPKDLYATGDAVYSNVLHINGGATAPVNDATLYVGDVQLAANGEATGNTYTGATYAAATNTLTLSGVSITDYFETTATMWGEENAAICAGIYYSGSGPLHIELVPDSTNTITLSPGYNQTDGYLYGIGIYSDSDVTVETTSAGANLTFNGATLNVADTYDNTKGGEGYQVKAESIHVAGDLTLQEYLKIKEAYTTFSLTGVSGQENAIANNIAPATVYARDTLTAQAQKSDWGPEVDCRYLRVDGALTISQSKTVITANTCKAATALTLHSGTATLTHLYAADAAVTVSGGTLTANDLEADALTVNGTGAELKATDTASVGGQAQFLNGTTELNQLSSGGTLKVGGSASLTVTAGTTAWGGVMIEGAPVVSLKGNTALLSGNHSTSGGRAGNVTISGGTVTITGTDYGMDICGALTINGGSTTVNASCPVRFDQAAESYSGALTVSDGYLKLTGTNAAMLWEDTDGNAAASTPMPAPTIDVSIVPAGSHVLSKVVESGGTFFVAAYVGSAETELAVNGLTPTNALSSITFGANLCPDGHTIVIDPAVAATCTEPGKTAGSHCSVCGAVIVAQEVVAALGHDYNDVVTAPTCTEQGYTIHTCSRCNDVKTDTYTDALGHDYDAVVTEPTCTEQGYTTHTCSRCNDVKTDTYIEALGHSYTYAANGAVITETCENGCNHSATATISVPNNTYTYTGAEQTPATVVTTTDWAGDTLTPIYSGNTNAGTATVSVTKGSANASTTFTIAKADYTVTPSAASGTITVGATDGPALNVTASGVNGATVNGTLEKWYSDSACTQSISSFAGYAVGEYTIYWKFVPDSANYIATPKTDSYTLTVAEGAAQSMTWVGAEGNLSTTYGTPITGKTATNSSEGGGAITYSSSKPAVATVNATTGALTVTGAGETVIIAKAAAVPGKYRETQITYYLTVSKKDVTVTVTPVERKFGEGNPTFEAIVSPGTLVGSDTIDDLGLGLYTTATASSNVGSYDVAGDDSYNPNYKVTIDGGNALTVTKADAQNLTDIPVTQKYTLNTQQSKSVAGLMPDNAGTLTYAKGTAIGTTAAVSSWDVDASGNVTFTLNGSAGNIVTLPVTIGSTNYADSTVNVVITLTDKDVPAVNANAITVSYTGNAVDASAITGTATFGGNPVAGTWSWKAPSAVTAVADTGVKTVVFTPDDTSTYATVEAPLTLTINKATSTGAPKYTAIGESGKTLADAGLTTEGGTFIPAGSVKWVDADGNDLLDSTTVTANTTYRWLFTPADTANYNTLGGSVTLYPVSTGGGGGTSAAETTPTTSTSNGTTTAVVTVKPSNSGTSSSASVTADAIQSAVDAAVKADTESAAVEIQVNTPANATEVKVSIPTASIKTVADSEAESLTIQSGVGSVTVSSEALSSIAKQAGSSVEITVSEVDTAKTLNERQQAAAGDAPVYDLSVKSGSSYISQFDGGLITVSLPYTLKPGEDPSGVVVWYLDENGNIEKVRTMYDTKTKTVIFTTNHFSLYAVGYDETAAWVNSFTDIAETDYYYDAVRWAAANGITGGTSATTFSPANSCTRAQAVTFLWRAAGSPAPKTATCPFTDVKPGAYYYDAVLWAVETGVTDGTSATTFAPDAVCSRGQIVTFLWRSAGWPAVTTDSPFTDVDADSYYHAAVLWAAENGITNGTSATTFSPGETCVRGQIVTFLYRSISK